jgi:hypothetical protein
LCSTQALNPSLLVDKAERCRRRSDGRSPTRRGEPFDTAWARNSQAVLRLVARDQAVDWRRALDATVDAWRLAYARESIPSGPAIEQLGEV